MSGTDRTRSTGRHRWRRLFHGTAVATAALFILVELVAIVVSPTKGARAAAAPPGAGFVVTPGDLKFILKQINISEFHSAHLDPNNPCAALVGPGANQIPDRLTAFGLRTVDGSCNNLFPTSIPSDPSPNRFGFGAADEVFPRMTKPLFRSATLIRPPRA